MISHKAFKLLCSVLKMYCLLAVLSPCSQAAPRERRIVNGQELPAHSWPWLASLHFSGPQHVYQMLQGLPHLCGGVLIEPQWVLSAAHCFMTLLGPGLNESSNWHVLLGEHNRLTSESTEQRVPVERIYKHPDLTVAPFGGDIALLKLAHPVSVTPAVRPIEMDPNPDLPLDARCQVAGWGQMHDASHDMTQLGRGSIVPMEVELHHVSTDACRTAYENASSPVRIDNSVLCFGSHDGRDSCQGDSGTPLICWPTANRPVVSGILSLGYSCGLSSHPGVYSSIPYYRHAILDMVMENTY